MIIDTDYEPDCKFGYSMNLIENILGDDISDFSNWFYGQTGVICDGRTYNHGNYEDSNCGPHGLVVYIWDFDRYMRRST